MLLEAMQNALRARAKRTPLQGSSGRRGISPSLLPQGSIRRTGALEERSIRRADRAWMERSSLAQDV